MTSKILKIYKKSLACEAFLYFVLYLRCRYNRKINNAVIITLAIMSILLSVDKSVAILLMSKLIELREHIQVEKTTNELLSVCANIGNHIDPLHKIR